ncbi:PorT family protein [Chitinophaga oryzae]|uniref:PorT family protein n=1 Tax=Chitinophaga oryzae TaxID=2725414 RepID=A0AAE6ZEC7_9BACT|nr:porin family protein [Chitinophaga oryzae]QJB31415.1 PorT family protein [Chitinophaga oryzae]QJB37899.1 PorT family protein [Chitinophaga oryzae]
MNIKIKGLVAALLLTAGQLSAQQKDKKETTFTPHLEHRIIAGFNFGASAPVNLPNTIRKINGYWPEFSPSLGYELGYRITPKWGAAIGVKLDYKGMGTKDEVMYFPTIITTDDGGTFSGIFTGKNKTTVRNAYVVLPLSATFTPNQKWRFSLGGYAAWLFSSNFYGNVSDGYIRNGGPTGEKVIIDHATFDFGTDVRKFDIGLQGGALRKVGRKLEVMGNLNWGLRPLFPGDFKGLDFPLYNIYLTLGVAYKI